MLEEKIKELARKREALNVAKERYELARKNFEELECSTLYQFEKTVVENLEDEIRTEAVKIFAETGDKLPHEAVEIKEETELIVDEPQAEIYAYNKFPQALTLDRKIFDRLIRALPEEKVPDCVKIEKVPSAYIKSDLSEYLEKT